MVEELEDQLSIKLKNVPREEEEEEEEGYGVFYGESEKKKKITRICHVCNKGFSSGKALGGHMRIHGQLYKKRKEDAAFQVEEEEEDEEEYEYEYCYDDNEEERMKKKKGFMKKMKMVVPVCLICGKDFQSMKSLYGHMRSHPRDWKGIHPPAAAENPVVDLKKALKCRWSVTAKRGRKVISGGGDQTSSLSEDTEEEQLRDAAHELMMLAHGGESRRHDQELDSKSLSYEVMTKNVRGKAKAPENQESKKKSMISGYRETRADEKTRKKRMKLIKLKDLESVHHNATATIDHDNRTPAAAEKYKCSECDKWFRTHQALGGHKSSHNKLCKMVIQNSIDDDPLMPSNQVTNSSGELSHHNHQILDFDLNEVPQTTE